MRATVREESGFALISALMLTLVMLALGFGILATTDTQQSVSGGERKRESSFNIAEAALNAQAAQLSRGWPSTSSAPTSCVPSSTDTACPEPSAVGGGYTAADYSSPCSSSPSTPAWRTAVRDNASGEQYWSTAVNTRYAYDQNNDGKLWVRSTGFVRCKEVSVVALASRGQLSMSFASNVVTANFIATSNQGRKVLIDTLGQYAKPAPQITPASQPASVVGRCNGLNPTRGIAATDCFRWDPTKGQVQPDTWRWDQTGSTSAMSLIQLQSLERQAQTAGTYWPSTGPCPSGSQLSSVGGAPVVVQGPCAISVTGNSSINSSASLGALVIENGTLKLGASFYGLVYGVNKQGSSGSVVTTTGNGSIQGVVAVDGLGGVTVGASQTNIVFDPRATTVLRGDAGASLNKDTFRVLPGGTSQ